MLRSDMRKKGHWSISPQRVTGRPLHVSSTGITLPTQYPEDGAHTPDATDTHQAAGAQDDLLFHIRREARHRHWLVWPWFRMEIACVIYTSRTETFPHATGGWTHGGVYRCTARREKYELAKGIWPEGRGLGAETRWENSCRG